MHYAFPLTREAGYFWLEVGLFLVLPIVLLSFESIRNHSERLYWACAAVVAGFIVKRLNVSINALQTAAGAHYVPKWTEFSITLMIVAIGFAAFAVAVRYLPIFQAEHEETLEEPGIAVGAGVLSHAGD